MFKLKVKTESDTKEVTALKVFLFPVCLFSELYEHHYNSNTGKVLFTAAKTLCQMLQADVPMVIPEGMDLPAVIHDLACQAITLCNSGKNDIKFVPTLSLALGVANMNVYSH